MLSDRVIRNSAVNAGSFSWQAVLSLLITPYIVWRLGDEVFGLWSVVVSIVALCSLLDFDLSHAFVKHIAEYHATNRETELNRVVNTGLLLYLLFGAAIATTVWWCAPWIVSFFPRVADRPELLRVGRFALRVAALIYAMETGVSALTSVPRGVQRLDLEKGVLSAQVTGATAGAFIVLRLGYGLRGLALNYLVTAALSCGAKIFLAFRLAPSLRISPRHASFQTVRELFPFCWRMEVMKFSQLANLRLDKLLIGYFISIEAVTWYHIGALLVGFVRRVPNLFIAALMPAFSALSVTGERKSFYASVMRATKYLTAIAVSISFFILSSAGDIVRVWMGEGYGEAASVAMILVFGYCVSIAVGGGISPAVIGMGRPGVQMKASILNAVMNTSLSIILILWMGFYGAAWGTTIAMTVAAIYFMACFRRLFPARERVPCGRMYARAVMAGAVACLPVIVMRLLSSFCGPVGRVASAVWLGAGGILFGITYLIILRYSGFFDYTDRMFISRYMPVWRTGREER